ncbi:MAG: HAMP domain-containing histidine kinase [Planctomycetes bacterium]|nr:HAMP domain-containing histidine kinase [Planctomycetota bacterium]
MNRHRRSTWIWYGVTALALLGALLWLTLTLLALDRDELAARRQATLHEKLRLALWRMDSWLSPQLAREAMRPAEEYRAYAPRGEAWTKGFAKLPPGEVLTASPLLEFRSEIFRLHFEVGPAAELSSPQVPTGNQRDVAESNGVPAAGIESAGRALDGLRPRLGFALLDPRVRATEELLPTLACSVVEPRSQAQVAQSEAEYNNRQIATNIQARSVAPRDTAAVVGPLVPVWLLGEPPCLVFARRVRDAGGVRMQGVVADWPALRTALLALVPDLFGAGQADLVRCEAPGPAEQGTMLATVPARLVASLPALPGNGALPTTAILAFTWGLAVLALAILGFTVRTAIGYGERRARFASAVTHELRTPLTTFRMYSEMLADGVVQEPKARHEYLETLRQESDRLARVVENVLAWARLEEGRFASRRERVGVATLCERVLPALQRRAQEAGMAVHLDLPEELHDVVLATDEDAVGQILFNLVDNAAKYARGAREQGIEVKVSAQGGEVRIAVRDHGPGVPPAHRAAIFAPYDRGAVATASNEVPGVGLGLALARGLARDLGGDLRLDPDVAPGACFVLSLPRPA